MEMKLLCFFIVAFVIVGVLSVDPYGHGRRNGRQRDDRRQDRKPYAPTRLGRGQEPGRRRERERGQGFHHGRRHHNQDPGPTRRGGGREFMDPRAWDLPSRARDMDWDRLLGPKVRGSMNRARDWMRRLFRPGRYHFGVGPEDDESGSLFDVDFRWGPWAQQRSWWQGPNVCLTRTEEPENPDTDGEDEITSYQSTFINCAGTESSHKCTTTLINANGRYVLTELYECCRGYTRVGDMDGCPMEITICQDIGSSLEELGLTELISSLESAGLTETLSEEDANFTIFAPTNEALSEYTRIFQASQSDGKIQDMNSVVMVSKPIAESIVEDARNLLLGHVVVGSLSTHGLSDNQLLETASPFKTKIRMNFYRTPRSLVTANCAPLSAPDNFATNGVVHQVEKILTPVTDSILDVIRKTPELSTLKTALGSSSLGSQLREDGHITLLAPTNIAFNKLDQALLGKLLADQTCLNNVLKNHVMPKVICSSVLQSESFTSNLLHKHLNLTRDQNDKLFVNGVQIVTADIMATNGVIYIIEDVLIPEEALGILDLAREKGYEDFVDVVTVAGLTKELSQIENTTVFVPSNEAIQALGPLSPYTQEQLQDIVRYHFVPAVTRGCNVYNGLKLDTMSGDKQITINEYSTFPYARNWIQTAQCARILKTDIRGCNGVIHTVDKVLLPPRGNVIDVLATDDRFTSLLEFLKVSEVADALQGNGPFTIFAPTNQALEALGSDAVDELKENPTELKKLLMNHVTRDTICCAGITRSNWLSRKRVNTLGGNVFSVSRDYNDIIEIGDATVEECDIMATNGVVHVLDDVLQSPQGQRYWDWRRLWRHTTQIR